jgi:hypothetical protein
MSPHVPRGHHKGDSNNPTMRGGGGAYDEVLMARQASLLVRGGADLKEGGGSEGGRGAVSAVESAWSESEEGEEEVDASLRGVRNGKVGMASTSLGARTRPSSGLALPDGVLPMTRPNGEPPTLLSGVPITPWRVDRFRVAWPGLVASNHGTAAAAAAAAADGTPRLSPPNDSFSHIV